MEERPFQGRVQGVADEAFRPGGRGRPGLKPRQFLALNAGLKTGSSTKRQRWRYAPNVAGAPTKLNIFDVIPLTAFIGSRTYDAPMDRTFFITSVTAQRRRLFQRDEAASLFIDVLFHYRGQGKYLLHEFVVMPDHFHALITPAYEISLERAVHFIKGGFSYRLKSSLAVWQASFTNHRIHDDVDCERHREYIWMNPVRAGLVRSPEEYVYSSANGRFALDPMPPGLKPISITA